VSWRYKIVTGDCLDVLKRGRRNKIDAVVCDPPAGIEFMGKDWDSDRGGMEAWVEWLAERLRECRRVMKPGAHMLVWALPRTSHWTGLAIERAGFEIRDRVSHLFGTGFPKGGMISKSIDKKLGAEPTVVGENPNHRPESGVEYEGIYQGGNTGSKHLTAPTSPEAKQWEGWGSALKPACEDWWLARKPFKGPLVKNVLDNGVGCLNIDACRIGYQSDSDKANAKPQGRATSRKAPGDGGLGAGVRDTPRDEFQPSVQKGRWPAHVVLSHHPECKLAGMKVEKGHKGYPNGPGGKSVHWYPGSKRSDECRTEAWEGIPDREVPAFDCHEDCPVRQLDEQSGITKSGAMKREVGAYEGESVTGFLRGDSGPHNQHGDEGGASRFFTTCHPDCPVRQLDEQSGELYSASAAYYTRSGHNAWPGETEENAPTGLDAKGGASRFYYCAKPGKKERSAGLPEGVVNKHPTVKSVELMRWLVRLVTPPNGIVLDPFMGSGSTGVACAEEGFRFVGIELEEDSTEIARARIAHAYARAQAREEQDDGEQAEAGQGGSRESECRGEVEGNGEGMAGEEGEIGSGGGEGHSAVQGDEREEPDSRS
jgi:hypothetical protein